MAASTIPNSGGPGSKVELSAVTIAVRDKVIEKFAAQPLDEMNESVKKLLSKEEDEQKRLGILAARVYILRQRILRIAEDDADRVVGSASPKPDDLASEIDVDLDLESGTSEWTRLRILEDCEVNGVRFPKTVIIDVKSEDAGRLIENGKAEVIAEDPVPSDEIANDAGADDTADAGSRAEDDVEPVAPDASQDDVDVSDMEVASENAAPADDSDDDLSALSAALETAPAPEMEIEAPPTVAEEDEAEGEAVIEAPSAAEVTAALEALSSGADSNDEAGDDSGDGAGDDDSAATPAASADDMLAALGGDDDDAADVAAELEAMSAAFSPQEDAATDSAGEATEQAADNTDTDEAEADAGEPNGWFKAQQDAEQSARAETDTDGEEKPEDEKA